jgi:hypothetical protein
MPSAIPTLYFEDGDYSERAYNLELVAWVKSGSSDLQLMAIRQINFDSMDGIIPDILANPGTDIAIIAKIFWATGPAFYIDNPEVIQREGGQIINTILTNLQRGYYQQRGLLLHRLELLDAVQAYAAAAIRSREALQTQAFTIPAALIGPFPGRTPACPPLDSDTAAHVQEIFDALGGSFESDFDAWARQFESNYWIRHYIRLPNVVSPTQSDDLKGIEAVYGALRDYATARKTLQDRMPYLGREQPVSWFNALSWTRTIRKGSERLVFEGV